MIPVRLEQSDDRCMYAGKTSARLISLSTHLRIHIVKGLAANGIFPILLDLV